MVIVQCCWAKKSFSWLLPLQMISFVYHNPSFGNFNAKGVTIEYSTALEKSWKGLHSGIRTRDFQGFFNFELKIGFEPNTSRLLKVVGSNPQQSQFFNLGLEPGSFYLHLDPKVVGSNPSKVSFSIWRKL